VTRRAFRRMAGSVLVLVCALTVVVLSSPAPRPAPQLESVADLSQFKAGNIITDAVFHDSDSMTAAQIKSFLALKGANCVKSPGEPDCIKDLVLTTKSRAADAYCNRYAGATESAAAMIKKVGVACGINPRVLIVMLQKEQGIVTQKTATAHEYSRAMGYGCPDHNNGQCDSLYNGLFNQVYNAAHRFKFYEGNPANYSYRAGRANKILYNPNSACGSSWVTIENQATANLYIYTPYQPNKAALNAGYGTGNSCSAYGNRNFFNWFTDWFGSTYVLNRDPDAPVGRLEAVQDRAESVRVKGWAYDPNMPTAQVQVAVYAGGTKIGTAVTDQPRADVAKTNYGAGPNQGFDVTLPLSAGKHTVCVYPVNLGAGSSNPRLGCATLTVTTQASWNPKGTVSAIRTAGTRLVVEGWSFDPDAPTWPTTVRVYSGSLRTGDVVADGTWESLGTVYPRAGDDHGFRLDTRLTAGSHRVCVYSFNKGTGTTNPRLGCKNVTITAPPVTAVITTGNPLGRLAGVSLDGQDVRVTGWSFDPDAPTAPATVRIVADGKELGSVVATDDYADVQKYFPYAGSAHGFTWRGILPHGSYDLCLWGVDQGAGSDTSLGCTAVTVEGDPASNPRGVLDDLVINPDGTVTVDGWAYDPDVPTAATTVRIFRGSTKVADVVANGDRPGLSSYDAHAAAGDAHGYEWTGRFPAGAQTICAYAINVKYGTTNTKLKACRTVTIAADVEERTPVEEPLPSEEPVPSEEPAPVEQPAGTEPTATVQEPATTTTDSTGDPAPAGP
jgi:hypothetical protein